MNSKQTVQGSFCKLLTYFCPPYKTLNPALDAVSWLTAATHVAALGIERVSRP
ncbi:hypothetical protein Hdeb2414_s0020g00565331 [Helianthus debilis subsp. tardiflorus]